MFSLKFINKRSEKQNREFASTQYLNNFYISEIYMDKVDKEQSKEKMSTDYIESLPSTTSSFNTQPYRGI